MNSRLLFAVLTATLLAGTSAQAQGWDVSVMGGPTWSPHIEVGGLTQGMDTGYNLGGRLEYNLDDWLGDTRLLARRRRLLQRPRTSMRRRAICRR